MMSSVGVGATSAGGTGTLYIDKTDDNYGIGEALTFHADAVDNIAIGENALNSTGGAALRNIAIGTEALTVNTLSDDNIAIGFNSMSKVVASAASNVAVGNYSMDGFSTAAVTSCVAIGDSVLRSASLHADASGTIAIGYTALTALTDGARNLAIGYQAMLTAQTANDNSMIGYGAGYRMMEGEQWNTVLGSYAFSGAHTTATTDYAVAIGYNALAGSLNGVDGTVAIG